MINFAHYPQLGRKLFTISLLLFLLFSTKAQKSITRQQLVWYYYNQTFLLNDKYYLQTELHERRFIDPDVQFQSLARTHLHRILGNGWETSVGVAVSLQNPNNPFASVKLTVPEFRPHIEFDYNQKMDYLTLDHRYRAEARYFRNSNSANTALEEGVDFANYRFRYRLQATIPLWKFSNNRALKVKFGDEIMLNAGSRIITNVCDQNRITGSLSMDLLANFNLELGYLHLFQQRSNGAFYERDILLCTVSHKINLKNKSE